MPPLAPWRALSAVLILSWGRPPAARACPHPCSCYVPSEVHCTFRSLAAVPAGISPHVERINLGFNSIQALSETSFAGLRQLELLMLHGNSIPSIPDGALRDLRSLQVFKVSYNKLQALTAQTLQGLVSVVRLHLDHNEIAFIHPHAFEGLASLRLLHLEGNLLQQLHPGTFGTFSLLDHFRVSSLRHLYLAENRMRSLPAGMLESLPLLENLYLQGNPWSCDCSLQWLLQWDARSKGILKCKKDKAYPGGQLCASCSSPRKLQKQELHKLTEAACVRPSIESPLRQNRSGASQEEEEEEEDQDDDSGSPRPPEGLRVPPWNVSLNMTDEHGNAAHLVCDIPRRTHLRQLHLNQTEAQEMDVNATLALDFECPMTRGNYEKLWKLIAYYSEVPVTLHREDTVAADPGVGAHYRQDSDSHALYYTGVRAHVLAEPAWVLQPTVALQLNRRQSTATKVLLSYSAALSFTVSGADAARPARSRSWVMIEPDAGAHAAQTVLEGRPCQLSCHVKASESPSTFWVLPDGTVLQGPMEDSGGRFSILTSGWLRIRAAERADSGVYQCVARVRDDMDRVVYRLAVEPADTQPPAKHAVTVQKNSGDPLALPCEAVAAPDAQVSWILPNQRMVSQVANTSQVHLWPNGTLSIPRLQASDSGYYKCVAVNQQGVARFTVAVAVTKKGSVKAAKRGRRPAGEALSRLRADVLDHEGGSGVGGEEGPSRRPPPPKDHDTVLQPKGPKKGRRKPNPWKSPEKEPESTVAEGRRVFESRRRLHMANKQINPERWADILARVRGKNVSPKGTPGPEAGKTTATPTLSLGVTAVSPVASPPSLSAGQRAGSADEFSADASLFAEEAAVSSTVAPGTARIDQGQAGVPQAQATVTSPAAEEFIEDAFSEKTGDPTGAGAASMWAAATTQVTGLPYPSSPAAQTAGGSHAEPPATTGHAGAQPAPGPTSLDHPLDASEPSVSLELQAPPQAEDKTEGPRSSPALWPAESPTSQPFGDFTPGAPDVGAQGREQGETGRAPLAEKAASTQDPRAMAQGSQQTSPRPQGEGALQRHPTNSRAAERRGQSTAPTLWAESTPGGRRSVAPFAPPREATLRPVGDEGLISAAAPTRQPLRRRPSGRRRGRPHKFRHRQTHTPAATLAPTQTSPMPPTPAGEGKPPKQVTTSLAPTSWVEATVGTPKQVETEQPTEPGTKGTPRRKLGKRPKKHRQGPATMSSASPPPDLGASAGNQHKSGGTPPAERFPAPTLISLKTGGPLEVTRVADSGRSTPRIPAPPHTLPDAEAATRSPVGGGSVTKKQDTHSSVPSEPGMTVTSPPGTEVSTVQELKEEPPSSGSPGPGDGDPPMETPTGGLQTEAPAATSSEYVLDSWSLSKERESEGFPAEATPPGTLSTSYQPEGAPPPTSLSGEKAGSPPAWTQPTPCVRDSEGTAAALPHSEMSPPNQGRTGAPGEDPAGPSPPTPPATAAERTPMRPTHPSSTAAPTSTHSSENASFDDEGPLAANTRPGPKEGAGPLWRRNEVSTLPSRWDELRVTPKPAPGPEDDRTQNILPRGPDGHPREGRFHVFQQTTHVPAGGAGRPPSATTQSPFRHLVTLHPPLPPTNKPGTTAHPSGVSPANQPPAAPTTSGPTGPVTPRWHPSSPSRWPSAGPNRVTSNPNGFGVNSLPDLRDPVGRLPSIRAPPNANGRFPYLPNRSLSFPPLGLTPKTPTPTSASPWVRGTHIHPSPYNRIHSQSLIPMDLGPPAPPRVPRPRTGSPPPIIMQNAPLVHPTRGAIPPVTSAGPPARSFHHSSSKIFSAAGGPPAAPKFWTLGEKPQILTKPPQTVSVSADTDVTLPCEATGKPTPFVTWTKVSTGALLTTNTRVQRFQVLQNGTFIIRKAQAQDRGQYVCTAKNLHGTDRAAVLLSVTVQQPQILASHYQDVTVYLGDTIAMECLAKGTPAPQISWIFPDRRVWQAVSPVEGRVTLHENRTLSIKEATFADRGVYKCVASNAAGADSLAIRLHVAALPPVIHQEKLENISLPPGLSIHIHCTAKAAPLPSVRWVLWDGTQVRPSQFLRGNLFVFPNGTLYIRNLAPKDSGRYECVAANVVGTARRTVQLTVRRAAANARITGTSPHRTNVHYGGTLRLDCSASGDPWPRILWRLPSKRMIDALFSFDTRSKVFSNGTLVVKSVTDKDAGDYLCVARNKVGDDFVVLKVNVVMQPAKIEHKEENDHRVFYGGDLKVDCVASGLPNPDISWSLPDGSLVSSLMQADEGGAQAQRYVVFHNGTLYFNEVGLREEGDYTCVAENQVGKDEMTVRVQVVAQPAAIRNKTHAVVHVAYGDVVSVACDAKGEPAPTVTWLTPTNKLIAASSDKYQLSRDGTLLIRKAQRSDSGNYTCLVRNSAGEDRKLVWVQVQVQPPKINGHPEAITTVRQEAAGGSRQLIHCRAEGIPAPKVLWAFPEGVVLPAPYYGNRVTIHRNGTLDIRGLRQSDSVPLTCIGRNEGGEARLIVQLTVLEPTEKPAFHDPVNEKITAAAGHTISLNCSARGTPPPTLVWLLPNGTELASGQQLLRFYHKTDGKLHISGLSAADAGAYRCVARNVAGRTERLVSLKVGLKPEASQQYRNLVSIVHGETLRLPCASPGGRQPRVTWTLPSGVALRGPQTRGRVSLGENGTLTVREASVLDRGTYACQADTDRGPSVVHFPVIVIAYPPRVTSEPTPVIYTRPGSTVKVACMAVGLPKPEISWELPDKSRLTAGTQARMLGNTVLHAQGSLTIQQVAPRDAGFYKCTAKNVLGSDSKTTYVHVY